MITVMYTARVFQLYCSVLFIFLEIGLVGVQLATTDMACVVVRHVRRITDDGDVSDGRKNDGIGRTALSYVSIQAASFTSRAAFSAVMFNVCAYRANNIIALRRGCAWSASKEAGSLG